MAEPQKVTYGQKGLKEGVPKEDQARNQGPRQGPPPGKNPGGQPGGTPPIVPGFPTGGWNTTMGQGQGPRPPASEQDIPTTDQNHVPMPTSYLSPKQQEKVDKWLGDKYDPSKPLNIQLFRARWQAADADQRQQMAQRLANQWIEGGPSTKSVGAFHNEYIGLLREENMLKAQELKNRIAGFSQTGGGWATTQEDADASLAHWTAFANTPEGEAHIAQTGMTKEEWLKSTTESITSGVRNFEQQQKQWSNVQRMAQSLGQKVPGFKPPGWQSTLQAIQEGRAPMPSAQMMGMYPGIVADLAGLEGLYQGPQGHGRGAPDGRGGGTGTEGGGGLQIPSSPASVLYNPYYADEGFSSDSLDDFPEYI